MFSYIIITEDGDVLGVNDLEQARIWYESDSVVIETATQKLLNGVEFNLPIDQADTLELEDDSSDDDTKEEPKDD